MYKTCSIGRLGEERDSKTGIPAALEIARKMTPARGPQTVCLRKQRKQSTQASQASNRSNKLKHAIKENNERKQSKQATQASNPCKQSMQAINASNQSKHRNP